ncbi:hypothetical protein V2W45_1470689 [Cenococcum geophilum]
MAVMHCYLVFSLARLLTSSKRTLAYHTAFKLRRCTFNASANRRESLHPSSPSDRAFQGYPSWKTHQGTPYDKIERQLRRDESLFRYVKDKIRYNYYGGSHQLVVRMPTGVRKLFIDNIKDAIRSQLKAIRSGLDRAALFAQKVRPARLTEIYFPLNNALPSTNVIIEVAYSQKTKRLGRLAEDYLLDSDASVQVVISLDIEYGKKGSRKATLLVWRTRAFYTNNRDQLGVIQEMEDEAFRDDNGDPTTHPELYQYLAATENKIQGRRGLIKHSILPKVKKRKRSETPLKRMASDNKARYIK